MQDNQRKIEKKEQGRQYGDPVRGRSGIIGLEETQEYQWFVGNRQVVFTSKI